MQNIDWLNLGTRIIRIAINILFVGDPIRTSLGIVLGIILKASITIFNPLLSKYNSIADFTSLNNNNIFSFLYCGVFGIFLIYLPLIISYILLGKRQINDESIEMLFKIIRKGKEEGNLTDEEVQKYYLNVIEKVIEKTQLKQEIQKELNEINQSIAQELLEGETKQQLPPKQT
ncbi:MAG: hypothetical protein QNJ37_19615 [Crocosphaera sp.]|nr:hypothetical protein [Crocosphaera sp.]